MLRGEGEVVLRGVGGSAAGRGRWCCGEGEVVLR